MGPVQLLARQGNFVFAQRRAVRLFLALLVGRTETDNRFTDNQAGLVIVLFGKCNGGLDLFRLVTIDIGHHVPAVGFKAFGGIVGKPAFHFPINRNAVVVIERNQLAQLLSTRQRRRLMGNAFHQAAVTQKAPGVVIDNGVARAVELRCQGFFGNRKADRVGKPLTERAGGGFDAGRVAKFRMAGGGRVQLPEVLKLFQA
ncbi:hypothetical protein CZ787_04540 [Halomonas citrativorans]|uniref:Uncharacterized protein n=1 Tax=Halomonas citrativorans TaxID=2742612 RepID=A0A1R4HTZ3_9GAMM|nr:hypothetical protein CZ787_04540 [Halomonas citrativorans]